MKREEGFTLTVLLVAMALALVVAGVVQGQRITYSIGTAPSAIWRGKGLMRCGPAYGLAGELSSGAAQNRVVLDGLAPPPQELEKIDPSPFGRGQGGRRD